MNAISKWLKEKAALMQAMSRDQRNKGVERINQAFAVPMPGRKLGPAMQEAEE